MESLFVFILVATETSNFRTLVLVDSSEGPFKTRSSYPVSFDIVK